jgi:TolB-like protein/tetratricopeptide (TPR) repeat protein
MTELMDRVRTALAGRYTIERELGHGGMATVYLASDPKHERQVAVKVFNPELAHAIGPERFLKEIQIAARLTHPNILPLHDSGEADGLLYYVMPYVAGESLADRLRRERHLKLDDAVDIVRNVAQALTYAHGQGFVHRDIKPENILVMGERAVVADFGIAHAVDTPGVARLTETGVALGTPAYMSPEQASGDRGLDGRSDVYSLGCLAYEMLGGDAPFTGPSPQAVLARHAVDPVPRLRTLRPNVPVGVERAIEKALAKVPADRFDTAEEFATALTQASTAEAIAAEAQRAQHAGTRRAFWGAGILAVVAVLTWFIAGLFRAPHFERLAVLVPTNLTNDSAAADFVYGMHRELISELQQAGVPVIARTSMLQYENTRKPAREIATELNVDVLAEPSVLRSGDSVQLEVQLVNGQTEQYMGDPIIRAGGLRDVVTLYRQVTNQIAREIGATLSPEAARRLTVARPVDPAAFQSTLTGWLRLEQMNPAALGVALESFQEALEHDSAYAPAYAGIAGVWATRVQFGLVPPAVGQPLARTAAERAIALDSTNADAYFMLGAVRTWGGWDWAAGEAAFRRSIALNPSMPLARAAYSHLLAILHRPDEAIEQIETAVELDPLNLIVRGFYAALLGSVDRYDDALTQAENVLRQAPNHNVALSVKRGVLYGTGRYAEVLDVIKAQAEIRKERDVVAALEAGSSFEDAMRRAADVLTARAETGFVSPLRVATLYMYAGDGDRALDWLERALEGRDQGMPYIGVVPDWDRLHDEPRFQSILRRMNLPLP